MVTDHVFPQHGDEPDAANFASYLGQSNLGDYVESGLNLTVDYASPNFDLSAGKAYVLATTYDTATPDISPVETRQSALFVVEVEALVDVGLSDNTVNYVFLDAQISSDDSPSIVVKTTDAAPSDESIKIAEVDTSADTKTELNRSPTASYGGVTLEGDMDDGSSLIFDYSNGYIPLTILEADSLTVAGNPVTLGGSTGIDHADLSAIGSADHHSKYTNEEAQDAVGTILGSNIDYDDSAPLISLVSDTVTVAGNAVSLGGSTPVDHADLSNIGASDHHSKTVTTDFPILAVDEAIQFTESDIVLSGPMPVSGGSLHTRAPYNIQTASKSGNSLDTSAQPITEVHDATWGDGGSKLFVVGRDSTADDYVLEYDCSTAYDITTATHNQNLNIASNVGQGTGIEFSGDGFDMWILDRSGEVVYDYSLSTAWDVSSASLWDSFDLSSNMGSRPEDFVVANDGKKMYVADYDNQEIDEYDIGTAWAVSTLSFKQSFNAGMSMSAVELSADGKFLHIMNSGGDVDQYILSSAFDVSTAVFDQQYSTSASGNARTGLEWGDGGLVLLQAQSGGTNVFEHTIDQTSFPVTQEVGWENLRDIDRWDLATFQVTLDGASVTVNILDQDGNTLMSDISQDTDITGIANSEDIKFEFVFSGSAGSNFPTIDYAARRFAR